MEKTNRYSTSGSTKGHSKLEGRVRKRDSSLKEDSQRRLSGEVTCNQGWKESEEADCGNTWRKSILDKGTIKGPTTKYACCIPATAKQGGPITDCRPWWGLRGSRTGLALRSLPGG